MKPENRESGQFIEVLHPDFKEFGMSGKVYDRSDFECIELHVAEY
ncbi:TPA: nuclear transport factor 2 family protein, partial [Staphylococcus pseudintermedius]|nr:nuclear transport factor 2 family protein [Staphylococcus pseudintermedius]HAR5928012.1 nuclear transport factor 2 family protein [Staphylococcus pseudintermedius]